MAGITLAQVYAGLHYADGARWTGSTLSFSIPTGAGIDRVLDFSLADGDRVLLDPGTTFTIMQVGADTVIQMSSAQVVLVGIAMSSLPSGTIFGA